MSGPRGGSTGEGQGRRRGTWRKDNEIKSMVTEESRRPHVGSGRQRVQPID